MSRNRRRSIQDLPQNDEVWYVAVRRLQHRIYLKEEDVTFRPFVLMIFDQASELLLDQQVLLKFPSVDELSQFITRVMKKSDISLEMKPHRPTSILCEMLEWISGLREAMQPYSIEVSLGQPLEVVDEFIQGLNDYMRGDAPEIPGLLSVHGVTPELVADFFDAAAELWRSEPWVWLNDRQILAVHTQEDQDPWLVQIMGCGGYEYGFILYQHWQDILRPIKEGLSLSERLPGSGWHSLSFDPIDDLPVDDQIGIEDYGWSIENEGFCPFPGIFTHEAVQRPPREELILLEEIMLSVAAFTRDHLHSDGQGDFFQVETEIEVMTFDGPKEVKVHYPAGRFTLEEIPYGAGEFDIADLDSDVDVISFDRRSIERNLAEFARSVGEDHPSPEILSAQDIIYQAWETDSAAERVKIAQNALEVSPHCADAYNILAEDGARTLAEALDYYRQGVEAGEKALGKSFFEEEGGHFWGILETRPYMRARLGLANCLREAGELDKAIQHYSELLRLNTSDNQGIRYILLDVLMDMGQWQTAQELLGHYEDDHTCIWLYTRTLLTFYFSGATEEAERQLQAALELNPFVLDYLLRVERIPKDLPDLIIMGGDSEAVDYAAAHLNYWYRIPGAVDWLASYVINDLNTSP